MSDPVTLAVMLVAYRRGRSEATAGDLPVLGDQDRDEEEEGERPSRLTGR